MMIKEYSLSKKPDWPEYKAKTWFYLPKLYNSALLSITFYFFAFGTIYFTYTNGGIEATAKHLISTVS